MACHILEYNDENRIRSLNSLDYIIKSHSDSRFIDDALYFTGLILRFYNKTEEARSFFVRLGNSKDPGDDNIYDPYTKTFMSAQDASQVGLKSLY